MAVIWFSSKRSRLFVYVGRWGKRWPLAKQAAQKASCRRLTLCIGLEFMVWLFILLCRLLITLPDTDIISMAAIEAASVSPHLRRYLG